jgi:hypothetical protein
MIPESARHITKKERWRNEITVLFVLYDARPLVSCVILHVIGLTEKVLLNKARAI